MKAGDKCWYTTPRSTEIHEGIITKIGRKYFYVTKLGTSHVCFKVNLETMRDKTDYGYGHSCQVYLDKRDILEERETQRLWKEINDYFRNELRPKTSLSTLRVIAGLLGIKG